jgi:hypothetical protein
VGESGGKNLRHSKETRASGQIAVEGRKNQPRINTNHHKDFFHRKSDHPEKRGLELQLVVFIQTS